MLENGDPDAHCMCLNQTVELIDVQTIVNVSFKSHNVIDTSVLVPVVNFALKPAILIQNIESLFAPQEPRYENIHLIRLHYRGCRSWYRS